MFSFWGRLKGWNLFDVWNQWLPFIDWCFILIFCLWLNRKLHKPFTSAVIYASYLCRCFLSPRSSSVVGCHGVSRRTRRRSSVNKRRKRCQEDEVGSGAEPGQHQVNGNWHVPWTFVHTTRRCGLKLWRRGESSAGSSSVQVIEFTCKIWFWL